MPDEPADPLHELGRELRTGVGREFRAEAEEQERLADLGRRRARTLDDVAREAADRGAIVALELPGHTVHGRIVHVGSDLVSLATEDAVTHVQLAGPLALSVVTTQAIAPASEPDRYGSFVAALRELEVLGTVAGMRLVGRDREVRVRLAAVAADHVEVVESDGTRWFATLGAIQTVTVAGR